MHVSQENIRVKIFMYTLGVFGVLVMLTALAFSLSTSTIVWICQFLVVVWVIDLTCFLYILIKYYDRVELAELDRQGSAKSSTSVRI
jgi:hypothetical protein